MTKNKSVSDRKLIHKQFTFTDIVKGSKAHTRIRKLLGKYLKLEYEIFYEEYRLDGKMCCRGHIKK